MAKPVNHQVLLNGSAILTNSNYKIELEQKMAAHHKLTLTCPTESLEDVNGDFAANAKRYVGNKITLIINEGQLTFFGVIVNVSIQKSNAGDGLMVITANSPTIIMAQGRDSQSYAQKDLKQLLQATTQEYPSDLLRVESKPRFQEAIPYTVQYKESDFDFISRLARRYGEWLYYDGEKLRFGNHGGDTVPLVFGEDLSEFNFSLLARPQHHTYLAYDATQAQIYKASMADHKASISNPYINEVVQTSKNLFTKKPQSIYNNSLLEKGKGELENIVELKARHALNTLIFDGKSDEVKVALGNIVSVTGKSLLGQAQNYGSFLVTGITHHISYTGEYFNTCEGVPSEISVPTYFDEDAVPLCEEQYAEVKDNNDPQGLGRIRVQFLWQKKTNELTPWLRVSTPYAGAAKGFYILPEIGEEVLVGFENGNAEKPFIMSAHYNLRQRTPVKDPRQKIIQTKSGNKIILNDADGSVFISDQGKATFKMDGAGNIEAQAAHLFKVLVGEENAVLEMDSNGDVHINSTNTLKISVGGYYISINKGGELTINGNKVDVTGKAGDVTIKGKEVLIN